ncbi:MAG: CDP-diacylglycerol--glycerol-3-phosphate 3-phosphatidyltransferase [Bacilli bacterium]|jgi:CDP-diacylglycerol--glycerol-3-phosphate 3-phosphatidyltransferase|nr:CDP-diacylglycerol--glycerol-3-phosphate 3-phosphatidyltransferase [Bacilli bacterium]NLN80408.1 CDP-diacylglycerol--glycerol-3-phosphate 3-phosphatidyltransferase [Erysipelotrichia bacterium]
MNLPNKLSLSRIVIVTIMLLGLFVLSFFNLDPIYLGNSKINLIYFIVFVVFFMAAFTDYLDGHLARKYNLITDLGRFLDPIADKLLVNSLIIFLIVTPSYAAGNISFSLWCVILLIMRDLIVDALRLIAISNNKVIAANIFGKIKTVLQMVAISFVLLNNWPFSYFDQSFPVGLKITNLIIYLATLVSLISGIIYLIENRHVFKKDEK